MQLIAGVDIEGQEGTDKASIDLASAEGVSTPKREGIKGLVKSRVGKRIVGFVSLAIAIALWQILSVTNVISPFLASSPWRVVIEARHFYSTSAAWGDLGTSGLEMLYGFTGAVLIGTLIGVAAGISEWFEAAIDPFVNVLYSMPRIALAPLFVVWLGLGIKSKIAIIFLTAVFPVIITTVAGIRAVDRDFERMVSAFGASRVYVIRHVLLPGSVPSMVAGVRLAIGNSLIGMVVAELISSTRGIGYVLLEAGDNFQTDLLFVELITVALIAMVFTGAIRMVERRLDRWRI